MVEFAVKQNGAPCDGKQMAKSSFSREGLRAMQIILRLPDSGDARGSELTSREAYLNRVLDWMSGCNSRWVTDRIMPRVADPLMARDLLFVTGNFPSEVLLTRTDAMAKYWDFETFRNARLMDSGGFRFDPFAGSRFGDAFDAYAALKCEAISGHYADFLAERQGVFFSRVVLLMLEDGRRTEGSAVIASGKLLSRFKELGWGASALNRTKKHCDKEMTKRIPTYLLRSKARYDAMLALRRGESDASVAELPSLTGTPMQRA